MTNELKHWKYLKKIDVMVIPLCPKTPADPILGTHNGACGYACLHGIACHTTISIIWHIKKVLNHVKWGDELKMNWSIPISSGFQFQFNSNSKSFNSISIQFRLNWIDYHDYQFQFNSWIDPSPAACNCGSYASWHKSIKSHLLHRTTEKYIISAPVFLFLFSHHPWGPIMVNE